MKPFVDYKLNQVNFAMFSITVYVIMKLLLFLMNCTKIVSEIIINNASKILFKFIIFQ